MKRIRDWWVTVPSGTRPSFCIPVRKVNDLHSDNYSTLPKSPVQIFRVCQAAFPSKEKAVLFSNPLKGPGLDLHVKYKVTHIMKCIKSLNELLDVTGPTVR